MQDTELRLPSRLVRLLCNSQLESFLPQGPPPAFSASPSDVAAARLFLKAAARGRGNLLDFQALDPYRLLHGFSAQSVRLRRAPKKTPRRRWN